MIRLKNAAEIRIMKEGGQILKETLKCLISVIKEGISAAEIDFWAEKQILFYGAEPVFKGYKTFGSKTSFPASICVSLNEEIVHGIPSANKKIKNGDLISLDLGIRYKKLIVDAAISFAIGDIGDQEKKLLQTTKEALAEGIAIAKLGNFVGDIGEIINKTIRSSGFGVITDLSGHGVGFKLHEAPTIPNFGPPKSGAKLVKGMTFAIEPMASLGGSKTRVDTDGWTIKTADGSRSAHFEETIAITENGPDILTSVSDLVKI
mgnify:CR=1 FL=1